MPLDISGILHRPITIFYTKVADIHRPHGGIVRTSPQRTIYPQPRSRRSEVYVVHSSTNPIIPEFRRMQGVFDYGKTKITKEDDWHERNIPPNQPTQPGV